MHEARTHLSRLLERGEEIVIARAGTPVARLVSVAPVRSRRELRRSWRGRIEIAEDFDEPLPWLVFPGFPSG